MNCCCNKVIKLRQGDDSDFNFNDIVFHLSNNLVTDGWKAKFQLQHLTFIFDKIEDNELNLTISQEETESLNPGRCYGWLQLIDENGKKGTVFTQEFLVLKKEVF